MSTPLSGVTFDLSGLGAYISDAISIFKWPVLLVGGLILAGALGRYFLSLLSRFGAAAGKR